MYTASLQIWEAQGHRPCRALYVAIYENLLAPLFETRKNAVRADMTMEDRRTARHGRSKAALAAFSQAIDRLSSRWKRKIDVAARENEYLVRREQGVLQRKPSQASGQVSEGERSTTLPNGTQRREADDRRFERLAIEEARKSVPEDERVHPRVGVVVVKDGRVFATAHRGEILRCRAEYIALEKKLPEESLSGATVYTTLEPCTSRNHPKVPCAIRLAERKVARVLNWHARPGRQDKRTRAAGVEASGD